MKRLLTVMMAAAALIAVSSCEKDDKPADPGNGTENPGTGSFNEPTVVWEGHNLSEPVELEEEMDVKITVNVPNGIRSFVVDIKSKVLNEQAKISSIDFVNPDAAGILIVPRVLGDQDIKTAKVLTLDLSELMPMILGFKPESDTDHVFTLKLTDNAGLSLRKTITFHYTGTGPTLKWEGHDDLDAKVEYSESLTVVLDLSAPEGFKSVVLDIDSDAFEAKNITSIDFINPDGKMSYYMAEYFSGVSNLSGKTEAELVMTNFVSLLSLYDAKENSDHVFTLKVTDRKDQTLNRPITIHFADKYGTGDPFEPDDEVGVNPGDPVGDDEGSDIM